MDNAQRDLDARTLDQSLDPLGLPGASAEQGHSHSNLFAVIHRRLRGRYHWAALAAVVCAVPCAILGYYVKKPQFTSTGIIRVAPTLPVVMYKTEQNQLPQMFDAMVQAQASLVQSRNVLDKACEDKALRETGWPSGAEGYREMKKAIRVRYERGTELIQVDSVHPDAIKAQKSVNAVLVSYLEQYGDASDVAATENERALQQRERELSARLDALRKRVNDTSEDYGPDQLVNLHQSRIDELDKLDREISNFDLALNAAESRRNGDEASVAASIEALANTDRTLADLRDREMALKSEIERFQSIYGPNHRKMVDLKGQLSAVQSSMESRVRELTDSSGGRDTKMLQGMPISQIRERRDQLVSRRDAVKDEAARFQAKLREINSLQDEITDKKQMLSDTTKRLDEIRVERGSHELKRVTIVQKGDLPVAPDDKRMALAAFGGFAGALMGVTIVLLLTLLNRGYRYIDDLEKDSLSAPLLGTLPDLAERTPEQDELAALSVHHLRNMLQLQKPGKQGAGLVYTITSASSGDGKTSLALALGMSFAVSGQKTLLLDADLVGRGLTRELRLDRLPGLCQAVGAASLNGELHKSEVENLWMLPAGPPEVEAKHLSHASMERVLGQLRGEFDIILIDTGPILGSLEANLVAVLSDGVVVTVARGQSHKFVAACLERLTRMGATCAGLVFNRAQLRDFERSVSAASVCSQSLRPNSPEAGAKGSDGRRPGRGALVRAVMGPTTNRDGAPGPTT